MVHLYIYMYAEHGIQGLSPGPIVKQLCDLMLTRPLMSHHSLPLRWIIRRVSQLSRDVGQLLPCYGGTGRRQCLRRSRRFHWDQKILRCRLLICVNRLIILLFISLECAGGGERTSRRASRHRVGCPPANQISHHLSALLRC